MDMGSCTHDLDFLLNGVVRATADIRDENLRLKTENERLEKLLSDTLPELELLRKERAALKAAIRALVLQSGVLPPPRSQEPATFARLPCEVLATIFNYATAEPTYQFDPSVQTGSYSPWLQLLRMKKGLSLICSTSSWPGMTVLYRDIVLRRMGQVAALAETLRTPDVGPRLANLIKRIRWDSCVVAAQCSDVIREDLTFIFSECTQLQSFSYHPHHSFPMRCQPPDDDECEGFFNPLWFLSMPSSLLGPPLLQSSDVCNLRRLDMSVDLRRVDDGGAMFLAIHRILSTFKILESLTLGSWPLELSPSLREELASIPSVSLPSLTELQIFEPSGELDTYLRSSWAAPQLARLTVLISTNWSPMCLLEHLGSNLRYLHLYPVRSLQVPLPDVSAYLPTLTSTLSSVCPLLEHLIAPGPGSRILVVDSPMLTHLDFWTVPYGSKSSQDRVQAETYRLWTVDARSNAPSLRTVRFIFTFPTVALLAPSFKSATCNPDWPWVCHPRLLELGASDARSSDGANGALYHRFPLGWVAQTPAAIMPQDLWEKCWKGRRAAETWPEAYGDLDALERIMDEEGAESRRRFAELEARGEDPLLASDTSYWMSDDGSYLGDAEGDGCGEHPDEHGTDATMSENIEAIRGSEELQDGQSLHEGQAGEQPQQVAGEQAEHEGDEEANHPQPGAVAESILSDSEYPPPQLDRATILAAFRRARDRESRVGALLSITEGAGADSAFAIIWEDHTTTRIAACEPGQAKQTLLNTSGNLCSNLGRRLDGRGC